MKHLPRYALITLMLLLLTHAGCATVPLAPPELDHAAKQFQPLPDQGQLYVVRSLSVGMAILFQVVVDGKMLGGIAPQTYFLLPLDPGPHTVAVLSNENQEQIQLPALPGQQYFLEVVPLFGFVTARVGIRRMEEAAGKEAVTAAKRAQGLLAH